MNRIYLFKLSETSRMAYATVILLVAISAFILLLTVYLAIRINRRRNGFKYNSGLIYSLDAYVDNVFIIYDFNNRRFEYISQNIVKALEVNNRVLQKEKEKLLNFLTFEKRKRILDFFTPYGSDDLLEDDFEYIKPVSKIRCWILLRIYRIHISKNEIRYVINTVDITREKKTQIALKDALLKLHKANDAKKIFLSHMSHELKTPINGIIGMTQLALDSMNDSNKIEYYLNSIHNSSNKLLTLINNILDFSKMDSDKLILSKKPFQISEVLRSFSSLMNSQAELKNQEYRFTINNLRNDYLLGDSLRLIQILENCLSNSIKFTPKRGKIIFEVTEMESHADKTLFNFIISDTGRGMEQEYINHLYEPFEQENTSIGEEYGGTGIGMTIVKDLVELMGGNIHVNSIVDKGTTITIQIVFRINMKPLLQEEGTKLSTKSMEYDLKGKRVLVVEDNEINMVITYELLKKTNMKVETARNGYEALELFLASEKGYFDIILMDLQMPELDGYETAKAIRESSHPDAKTICIIAQTADDYSEDQLSYESGMNYHISKLIQIEDIYKALHNIIM